MSAYVETGQYVLLSGYDQYNVTIYDPQTTERWDMTGDATEYLIICRMIFLCALSVD